MVTVSDRYLEDDIVNDIETHVRIWYDVSMQNREIRQQGQFTMKLRKADIVLIAVCMLTAVLVFVVLLMHRHEGNVVRISSDGEVLAEIAFEATGTQCYLIRRKDGSMTVESCGEDSPVSEQEAYNLLSVSDGVVRMKAADCRDQICVRHRAVSAAGESIICLPHKLVIEIMVNAGYEGTADEERMDNGITEDDLHEQTDEALDGVVE